MFAANRFQSKSSSFRILCIVYLGLVVLTLNGGDVDAQCAVGDGIIIDNEPCNYSIFAKANFYTNASYSEILTPPLDVSRDAFLYMGVELVNTSEPSSHLLLETCWATKTTDYVVREITDPIVDFPGCPSRRWRSVVQVNNNGQSKVVTLRFPIFFLQPNDTSFYIHCTVGTCDNCPQTGCESNIPVPQTYTITAGLVTIGPVRRPETTQSANNNELNTVVIIVACVLGALVLIIVVIALVCYFRSSSRSKRKNQNKKCKESVPALNSHKPTTPDSSHFVNAATATPNVEGSSKEFSTHEESHEDVF